MAAGLLSILRKESYIRHTSHAQSLMFYAEFKGDTKWNDSYYHQMTLCVFLCRTIHGFFICSNMSQFAD